MSLLTGLGLKTEKGTTVVETKPFVDDEHTLLAARYDNGYWIKLADGTYRNATRRLVPDAADSMWSVKFAKAVTGPDAPWDAVLGQGLEIVPLSDPAKARAGQTLRSRCCSRESRLPAARSSVATGRPSSPRKTFRVSRRTPMVAAVPIVNAGPHLLVIDHKVTPSGSPDQANTDMFNATLWFSVLK